MALDIVDKPNTDGPDGTYPYGKIRDNTGAGNGTPVNTEVYGDFHQFFARLMAIAGIVANGLPDNSVNGFQLFTALSTYISSLITTAVNAEAATRGAADTTLQNNINLKADLASPALTGNPTAPTQSAGNNSTRLATTAYTDAAVAVEAATRGAADTTLNNLITAINAKNPDGLRKDVLPIVDWDMDANFNKLIDLPVGVSIGNVIKSTIMIRGDVGSSFENSRLQDCVYSPDTPTNVILGATPDISSGKISVYRGLINSAFDSPDFDATGGFVRGWVIIESLP